MQHVVILSTAETRSFCGPSYRTTFQTAPANLLPPTLDQDQDEDKMTVPVTYSNSFQYFWLCLPARALCASSSKANFNAVL
jgi:hypothetical protein